MKTTITASRFPILLHRPVNQKRSFAQGDRQQQTSLAQVSPPPGTDCTYEKRALTTAFELVVLSNTTYGRIDNGKGGLRAPRAEEVFKRYNPKDTRYLHRWRQEEEVLRLMNPSQKRHRPSRGRWSRLVKALVQVFADRCKEGEAVRKKCFERTAKVLFLQL